MLTKEKLQKLLVSYTCELEGFEEQAQEECCYQNEGNIKARAELELKMEFTVELIQVCDW